MDPGFRYGGEALFFIGVAARLISWVVRTTREIQQPAPAQAPAMAAMTAEQQERVMHMIADPPRITEHRCPKCGTLIHADIVHGGFGPCRKCGWTPDEH
jgi:predicted RNA-binding Zn-ribbon protein involved in translation (DUF1610 family)